MIHRFNCTPRDFLNMTRIPTQVQEFSEGDTQKLSQFLQFETTFLHPISQQIQSPQHAKYQLKMMYHYLFLLVWFPTSKFLNCLMVSTLCIQFTCKISLGYIFFLFRQIELIEVYISAYGILKFVKIGLVETLDYGLLQQHENFRKQHSSNRNLIGTFFLTERN